MREQERESEREGKGEIKRGRAREKGSLATSVYVLETVTVQQGDCKKSRIASFIVKNLELHLSL